MCVVKHSQMQTMCCVYWKHLQEWRAFYWWKGRTLENRSQHKRSQQFYAGTIRTCTILSVWNMRTLGRRKGCKCFLCSIRHTVAWDTTNHRATPCVLVFGCYSMDCGMGSSTETVRVMLPMSCKLLPNNIVKHSCQCTRANIWCGGI